MSDKCETCYFTDKKTGACTMDIEKDDLCVEGSAYVKALEPEDMLHTLFMVIFNLGGTIEISAKEFEKFDEKSNYRIEHEYDSESKKYILTTDPQPEIHNLIAVPKKILKKANLGRLKLPNMN